ncbi:MAG: glycerate kinase [Candidatus Omnitrophota bacterium]|jgi:glycerate kinase|nr:MAG: glycerate kinase [Candidatus Omnitrophota bacterium]
MQIVLAPNAFKECLSAPAVADAMEEGILRIPADIRTVKVPLADGGDGTTDALVSARNGVFVELTVHDPLMRPVTARYGLIDDGETAVMEMAQASGLWRLREEEKNPLLTSTFGAGEMMRDALDRGVSAIIVGIGGSATTDAGIGMAAALGYRLLDGQNREIDPTGGNMQELAGIDDTYAHPHLKKIKIHVACDVANPLLGPNGAAPVYGPQKGATPEMIFQLEDGLATVARHLQAYNRRFRPEMPGGGAAGGLGAGLVGFCCAELRSGFDLIADYARLDDALADADLALTGEGKIDHSTRFGKVPAGVGQRAKKHNIPAVALAGGIFGDVSSLYEEGISALFSITPAPISLAEAIGRARVLIAQTSEQVIRLWLLKN